MTAAESLMLGVVVTQRGQATRAVSSRFPFATPTAKTRAKMSAETTITDKGQPDASPPAVARAAVLASAAPLSSAERIAVAALSLLTASVFAWGCVLPWDKASGFVVACSLLTLAHLCSAAGCIVPATPERWRLRIWTLASVGSVAFLGWATWAVTTSAWYLSRLYGGLGQGMGAVLVAIWGLIALITLPLAVWGLVRTRGAWLPHVGARNALLGAASVCLFAAASALRSASTADVEPAQAWAETAEADAAWSRLLTSIATHVRTRGSAEPSDTPVSLNHKLRPRCDVALGASTPPTLIAHYVDRGGKPQASCIQGDSAQALETTVGTWLEANVGKGPVLLDRLTGVRPTSGSPTWLEALSLRPGLDGVCLANRCFAPWQLVAQSRFVTHSPLPFLGDLKFGASLSKLRRGLTDKNAAPEASRAELFAITTQSAVITPAGEVTPLVRSHPVQRPVAAREISDAAEQFEAHIVAAQQDNGQFRYTLDPFTREEENRQLNLARQAGTVFALCDVGSASEATTRAARLGLKLLVDRHRKDGERWALAGSPKDRYVRLGESALPLVALLTCRNRVGSEFDAAIAGLSRFVLSLQRDDGSFATDYDWKRQRPLDLGEALYAPGQALLALTLLDRLIAEQPKLSALGDPSVLGPAIQRGMNHVAHEHWDVPVYPFFFVEENWNCLTARAALERQRNLDYELFCLDYVAFKRRLILMPDSDVAPEFVGGFGFGNVIPPHNTGAAGFGEALAAAISVQRARGEPTAPNEAVLRELLGFLLRQQWTAATCAACTPLAIGSMSEHLHSPITRIDFGQHAWAALSNGAIALGLRDSAS